MSLRIAFLVYLAGPLLVAVAVAGAMTISVLEGLYERRLQEDLELIGRSLQQPMARAMQRDRQGALQNALESAFSFGRVYGAYLYDEDGQRIASAGAARSANATKEPESVADEARRGQSGGGYGEVAGQDVYSYFAPLTNNAGQITGLVQITRKASEIREYAHQLRTYGLGGLGVLGLVLTAVTFLGYQRAVGDPLQRLMETMRQVAAGERDRRAAEAGPREVAELSRTLNTMLDRMQRDREEIHQRRQAQERLRRDLQRSEKMASIGRLSAGVAHELGTPLSVVDGVAQRLQRSERLSEGEQAQLGRLREQTTRMTQIVDQLLTFGRDPSGSPRPLDVERLTRAVERNARELLEQHGAALDWCVEEGPIWIRMDPFRAEQVLTHLVTNAAQAAPGERIRVRWRATDADWAELAVTDQGSGVRPDWHEQIFEPFFSTKSPGQGSGLGLALVHSISEDHGGRVWVEEGPEGGAVFRVRLPRTAPPTPEGGE